MTVDVLKQLDRAQRFLEKNRIDDALAAYQAILAEVPNHLESLQALGDLYARQNQLSRAAVYYGSLFDRLSSSREEAKALALYTRFLKPLQQPPERVSRYALLLQKQNKIEDAIEQFLAAALAFELSGKSEEALACFTRVAEMDADNRERYIAVAELAERVHNPAVAARAYLRAGQLTTEDDAEALHLLARAHQLMPDDRSAALLYGQGLLRTGDPVGAVGLLSSLAESEKDATFLGTYAEALMGAGQLDTARAVLDQITAQTPSSGAAPWPAQLALANEYLRAGQDEQAVDLLQTIMTGMVAARREPEFVAAVDGLVEAYPKALRLAEFWGAMYSGLNRETRYFDALVHLFDLYLENDRVPGACETLEKLIDIDAYDFRNQQRLDLLQGRADSGVLTRLKARLANVATHASPPPTEQPRATGKSSTALLDDVDASHTLEDLLVQAEIFVQYSLQSKAIERLQRIAKMFPGQEESNERLRSLCNAVHWWPASGAAPPKIVQADAAVPEPAVHSPAYAPETLSDLTKILDINLNVFRQVSPRAMLAVAVNEVGSYLRATRCIAILGAPGQAPQMASEFCAPGVEASPGAQILKLMSFVERAAPDALGGLPVNAVAAPLLNDMGLQTTLGVQLADPETREPSGMLIAGFAEPHTWKPNETYFLQSVGDQMLQCVHHWRVRSLVRNLAMADEKTGLLARSSYQDCLLNESQRARTQNSPLALALLQVDGGPELVRQHGDGPFERYMDQLARTVQSNIRQADLAVKYTSWALAFILPDTPLSGARALAEKLRKAAGGVRSPWQGAPITTSVAIAEATARHDFDNEDIVTDLINRAEAGLEEARQRGGNAVIAPMMTPEMAEE